MYTCKSYLLFSGCLLSAHHGFRERLVPAPTQSACGARCCRRNDAGRQDAARPRRRNRAGQCRRNRAGQCRRNRAGQCRRNDDAIALANADAMTSANADAMTSANADAMTPANVEPASFSVLTTRTQMGGGGDSLEEGMEKRRPQAPLSQGTRRGTAPQLCRCAWSSKTGSVSSSAVTVPGRSAPSS